MRRLTASAPVLATTLAMSVALTASGCGGSDESTSASSTAGLTRAEYVKQGNAICQKGGDEVSQLRALPPPPGDEDRISDC